MIVHVCFIYYKQDVKRTLADGPNSQGGVRIKNDVTRNLYESASSSTFDYQKD
jgi:hypothetical protein